MTIADDKNLIENLGDTGEKLAQNNLASYEQIYVKLKAEFGQALIITNIRIYIIKWGFMTGNTFGGKCVSYEYNLITGVQYKTGFATGTFEVLTAATPNTSKAIIGKGKSETLSSDNMVSFPFSKFSLFEKASNISRQLLKSEAQSQAKIQDDVVTLIEKLADLRNRGLITEDEFSAKKKQLLGI